MLMGQSFDCWCVIRESEYPCRLHILWVSPWVSIHMFTSNTSLLQSPIRIICSPWCIHFNIAVLRSIKNWVLGSIWIFMITKAYNFCPYDPPALAFTAGQYVVMILVLTLLLPWSIIHDQLPRLFNSWPVTTTLHDTSSTATMDVTPLWNDPPEVVTWLYPVLSLLVLNHPPVLLYISSFMGILLQLLFT